MSNMSVRAALAAACCLPLCAPAAEDADIAGLRRLLTEMKQQYETRIQALEARIQAAEAKALAAADRAGAVERTVREVEAAAPAAERGPSAFNPAISLVLQGSAVGYSRDPEEWRLPGFQLGGESGLKPQGASLTETELTASANVDDWFFGQATLGLHEHEGETEVDVEEAFVDTLGLPAGLGLRLGRFYTEAGYVNSSHTHAWDFADAPLVTQAFLGRQYHDDGLRLSWLAPTDTYLELGMETLRGDGFPAGGRGDAFLGGAQNWFVRLGGDLGASHSYRLGLSHLRADPEGRASGHTHEGHGEEVFAFSGSSDLTIADLVWKWAPDGNARERNFVFQTEYFHRSEDGALDFSNAVGSALLPYRGTQQGFYVQGIFQFMPRWRVGLRYDRLWSDNDLRVAVNGSGEDDAELLQESGLLSGHAPYRWTLMADYTHSEFSRLRLQYARDHSRPGEGDDQVQLQYIMTLGAHGAHRY